MLQCLVVIEKALADCHVTAATRLPLTQRAHRILQSRKRKISDTDDASVLSHDPNFKSYTLSDFPEEKLTQAPEVSKLKCAWSEFPLIWTPISWDESPVYCGFGESRKMSNFCTCTTFSHFKINGNFRACNIQQNCSMLLTFLMEAVCITDPATLSADNNVGILRLES